jgi:hypothetical protein
VSNCINWLLQSIISTTISYFIFLKQLLATLATPTTHNFKSITFVAIRKCRFQHNSDGKRHHIICVEPKFEAKV